MVKNDDRSDAAGDLSGPVDWGTGPLVTRMNDPNLLSFSSLGVSCSLLPGTDRGQRHTGRVRYAERAGPSQGQGSSRPHSNTKPIHPPTNPTLLRGFQGSFIHATHSPFHPNYVPARAA